ncbi:MAG: glycosyltransferase family 2 protein [Bacteroidetes Order II. Incertae sedis bacterium]|nr:glycosyltransferase family 2 protein [Bacteroidetes Order II. bacterium]
MKLIIQIPCLNEAEVLPETLKALPREVSGFDVVEWLVVDDGSTDNTAEVARAFGTDHVVRHKRTKGLARAFSTGLHEALRLGADVIVNTDGDNQYEAADIPRLVEPILAGQADIVVGARPIDAHKHFSSTKKLLQKLGSAVVRQVSHTRVLDTTSGFRALNREAAQRTMVFNEYTYTLETIIQAGHRKLSITSVPVRVNEVRRPSRLFRSIPAYIRQSLITIVRIYVIYRPFHFFGSIGLALLLAGMLIAIRFLYYYFSGNGSGHIQSLILMSVLLGVGFQTILIAFVADLFAANRKMLEEIRYLQWINIDPETKQDN